MPKFTQYQAEDMYKTLVKVQEDINWMLNNQRFLNPEVFDYLETAIKQIRNN